MTRSAKIALGLAVLAAPALALAAQDRVAPPTGRDDRVARAFAQVDTNRDGYVTRAESEAAIAAARGRREARMTERRNRAFAALDADRNGQISRAEFDRAPRMAMARMAAPPPPAPGMSGLGMGRFERLDADRDGRISLAEARAARPRMAMRGRRGPGMMPPGHPPVPGMAPPVTPRGGTSDGPRPLGAGRD